jgi:hypothetical protein
VREILRVEKWVDIPNRIAYERWRMGSAKGAVPGVIDL